MLIRFAFFKHAIDNLLSESHDKLKILWKKADNDSKPTAKDWRHVVDSEFIRLSFAEAIGILNNDFVTQEGKEKLNMRSHLLREHELFLTDKFKLPVFVYNYPKQQKAFYVRENDGGGKTSASFDLLVPRVSELAGGSLREERVDKLEQRMKVSVNQCVFLHCRELYYGKN